MKLKSIKWDAVNQKFEEFLELFGMDRWWLLLRISGKSRNLWEFMKIEIKILSIWIEIEEFFQDFSGEGSEFPKIFTIVNFY